MGLQGDTLFDYLDDVSDGELLLYEFDEDMFIILFHDVPADADLQDGEYCLGETGTGAASVYRDRLVTAFQDIGLEPFNGEYQRSY